MNSASLCAASVPIFPPTRPTPKRHRDFDFRPPTPSPEIAASRFPSARKYRNAGARSRRSCTDGDEGRGAGTGDLSEAEFSVLPKYVPWDYQSIWSTMAAYFFGLHVPLSFGGLPAVCQILRQPVLDPPTEAGSLVLLQTLELIGALILLHYSAEKPCTVSSFFQDSEERNWIKAASFGLAVIILVVLMSTLVAGILIGDKDVNNLELKGILRSGPFSGVAFFLIYCFITPSLEEAVYRGFLLTSLASTVKWQVAVAVSALLFSIAHLSPGNFLQLFFIGCVLGSAYCWSGNLAASFVIHSTYNAIIFIAMGSS